MTYNQGAKVYLKFTQIEDGVDVYINAGSDVRNASMTLVNNNSTVEVNRQFDIDQSVSYIIVAVPKQNHFNTSFTFEYNTDGVSFPWYELFYNEWFVKHPQGETMFIIACVVGGIAACLILCGFYCCIR